MHIQCLRTGGFCSIRTEKVVDTAKLPPDEAERLARLARDFMDNPTSTPNRGRDRFNYRLSINDNGKIVRADVSENDHRELISAIMNT